MSEYREISVEEQKDREFNEFVDKELKEKGLRGVADEIDQAVRKEAEEGTLTECFCQNIEALRINIHSRNDYEEEDKKYFEHVLSGLWRDVDIFGFVSVMSALILKIKLKDVYDPIIRPTLMKLRKGGYSYKYLKRYVHAYLTQEERQEFGKLISDNKEWVEDYLSLDKSTTDFVDENFTGVENTPLTVEDGQREVVRVMSAATEDLLNNGEIQNTVLISKGTETVVLPMIFENEKERDMVVNAAKMLSNKMNPDSVITIAESWVSSKSEEEQEEAGEFVPPSEDPNRREAITVTVETPVAKWHAKQFFEKDEEGKVIISDLVEPERHDDMKGNFVFVNNN